MSKHQENGLFINTRFQQLCVSLVIAFNTVLLVTDHFDDDELKMQEELLSLANDLLMCLRSMTCIPRPFTEIFRVRVIVNEKEMTPITCTQERQSEKLQATFCTIQELEEVLHIRGSNTDWSLICS